MGKPTGFLEYPRTPNPDRAPEARALDYASLHAAPLSEQARKLQAARCMNCGVPFCQSDYGCPLHNLIHEWNDLIYRGDVRAALERLTKTSPFPEFTSRVCPALCEKACMLDVNATTNRDNELYLIETGFARGWLLPRTPLEESGKSVAVVGSGPSGLAAADSLRQRGHAVTVFERDKLPGGLLMYGIPNMKLEKAIVARRIRLMEAAGIRFLTGTAATPENTEGFDSVILAAGARKPRALKVPGLPAGNVLFAVDFLSETTRDLLSGEAFSLSAQGKHVIVIGGGDTGNDCVATVLRQGCASVLQLELLPAPPVDRTPANPWPEWPRTLRTDYGQEEAVSRFGQDPRLYETTCTGVETDESGNIRAARIAKVHLTGNGTREPIPETARTVPCDMMLLAMGFVGCDPVTQEAFDLPSDTRGRILQENYRVRDRLYVTGDARTGQSLVVRAIADGLACAQAVHRDLTSR
ncbi:MAG: glutamate synthase subunit beta [Clostridia bacterium]|nr:glutamate synthase subunit beta [Clostridia bacterium]